MKKLIIQIKKYSGELLLLIGTFVVIYNLSDFSHEIWEPGGYKTSYFYADESRALIAVGFILVIFGILVIRKKNK